MLTGSGNNVYEWIDDWAQFPDSESRRSGWAHPGVVVTSDGEVATVHPGDSTILFFAPDGQLLRSWDIAAREVHQLALEDDATQQYLWAADPGRKNLQDNGAYTASPGENGPQVLKLTLDGKQVSRITAPDHEAYNGGTFAPTSVTVHEAGRGGNGDVWVADGYGESYVHRFNRAGDYLGSINGEEGDAGPLACPHAVWIDYRKSEPELYIADRTNHRVQVYDLEGKYKRVFGNEVLTSPSSFAIDCDQLIVAELRSRLAIFDIDDRFVCYVAENEAIARIDRNSVGDVPGWPNNLDDSGNVIRSRVLEPGKLNSPHGIAVDAQGNIYSAEWLVGGRYTKLVKQHG
jgi:hypothetical protein